MRINRFLPLAAALALTLSLSPSALALDTTRDSQLLQLVNKTHPIPASFVPQCVTVSGSMLLRPEAAQAYQRMYAAMTAGGVSWCGLLSAYRSFNTQRSMLSNRISQRMSQYGVSYDRAYELTTVRTAPPGCSEHQTGLAIDLTTNGSLSSSFASTAAGRWMAKHCAEYGYILRYAAGKEAVTMIGDEAWHYRYVGVPHAQIITQSNFCFEEYIDYLHQTGSVSATVDGVTYDVFWTDDPSRDFPGREITDLSSDNAGGWIVTTLRPSDPYALLEGHWALDAFRALEERGAAFDGLIDPQAPISERGLMELCGLEGGDSSPATREGAAVLLAPLLPDQTLVRLRCPDLSLMDGGAVQSVQTAVRNGIFLDNGAPFRPKDPLSWGEAAVLALRFREAAGANE